MTILGHMCRCEPEMMHSYEEKCIKTFLSTLKAEVNHSNEHSSRLWSSFLADNLTCLYFYRSMFFCIPLCLSASKMKTKSQKGPDFSAMAGALEGINIYLYNFMLSAEENGQYAWEIFDCTRKALLANSEDVSRYAMPRGTLSIK